MFSYERIQTLNQLEMFVYKYVAGHLEECKTMTIRDLSAKSHVSSTTVLRFLKKMGYEGFSDFKYALRHHDKPDRFGQVEQEWGPIAQFLTQANLPKYRKKISAVAQLFLKAHTRLFLGMGSSSSLAQYGARVLSNYGLFSLAIMDPYQPQPIEGRDYTKTLIMFLSVSGESDAILRQANYYRQNGATTVAVTANHLSTLARVCDHCLAYDIPEKKVGTLDFTSQVPVVYVLEQIGQRCGELMKNNKVTTKVKK
ncbi:SIS domain-containing protein [Pediococcus acidilactici]|uniref:MurR/RpiR family transcriptional regulator n=1 Tax=Pediococcus acidilactici TaxID=1254 RepID=UPI0013207776|nr:MurR/RpiR family transcriptional regulator [Pediococcus acidilactici]KAF0464542.1 SIS domain-containing protein [Pediococcus acidilactici]KAF0471611.1 SIS domain-containing protein [Pediococcus acidilactici]KAF0489324.1 SIS domain-containing protein [Pediococcus acidilactici]KAF0525205.1 SIS domain-containing protein [Pediococcus acidilactici]KAF0796533.1 SIS domain-containing protein [Pediococcus acidilactici]